METGLVRKIKDGDREAFDRFCLTLYPAMLSYAKVFLSDEGAEDIVQDVMLGVWRRREQGSAWKSCWRHNRYRD